MFPSLAARETYVAETNFAARKQKMFLPQVKNILLPGHKFYFRNRFDTFPSLDIMKTMLTRFQCCSFKMFSSNGERATKNINRDLKQTTTATATRAARNQRFNEKNNSCARAL